MKIIRNLLLFVFFGAIAYLTITNESFFKGIIVIALIIITLGVCAILSELGKNEDKKWYFH